MDQTVNELQEKGAPGITIVTVHPVGYGFGTRFSLSERDISHQYYDISKIELVCDTEDFETFVNTILENAHTGSSGDDLIFVYDVKEAIKIRTKKRVKKASH
ncbi:MAG: P-II family nitrogen regulator [Candidatus Zixiibacteriota bacterium]|nr:MAG: P-II family nitrogen regulator [candidate division Zixibacteria bacterium]